MREKDGNCTMQITIVALQEQVQKLLIENGALKSENSMLRSQVSFMEKLILKQNAADNTSTDESTSGEIVRHRGADRSGQRQSFLPRLALVCMIIAVSYLPEAATKTGASGTFQERMLAEVKTGFNLFNPSSVSGFILSLVRSGGLLFGLYLLIHFGLSRAEKSRTDCDSDTLRQLLTTKKNS